MTAAAHPTNAIRLRSIDMNCLDHTLARDRIRETQERARQANLARAVAATRRWHRVSAYARAAEGRHAARVKQVTAVR